MDFIQTKNFCFFFFNAFKKMRRLGTDWENIFTKHISDKESVFRIFNYTIVFRTYKEFLQLNDKKKSTQLKWAKFLYGYFTQKKIQMAMASKHMKICSTSLVIQGNSN